MGELVYVFYPRNKSNKLAYKWFGPYRILQAKHPAYEIDLGTKSEWLTRDKLKVAPKNSQVASPFIDEQDPRPSETSDITNTVSSESEDEVVLEGDNIVDQPPRYNRRYNLRLNPHIPQPFGDYYVHCCDVIKNIFLLIRYILFRRKTKRYFVHHGCVVYHEVIYIYIYIFSWNCHFFEMYLGADLFWSILYRYNDIIWV